jgi:hypothetical protein
VRVARGRRRSSISSVLDNESSHLQREGIVYATYRKRLAPVVVDEVGAASPSSRAYVAPLCLRELPASSTRSPSRQMIGIVVLRLTLAQVAEEVSKPWRSGAPSLPGFKSPLAHAPRR